MRGLKAHSLAKAINERLYSQYNRLSEADKVNLYKKYFKLLKKSAYLGYPEVIFDYAQQFESMSFLGLKNPMYNPKKCIFWYSKACEKEYAEACNNLAALYENGEGCKKDLNAALALYKQSASLGSTNGKKNFKIMIKDLAKGGKYNK